MKLEATNHSYYCSETNYYVDGYRNHGRSDYDTWQDFKEAWLFDDGSIDHDYNHCFRFDILETHDEDDNPTGEFYMLLFMMLQRKGIFRPVYIRSITEDDMPEVEKYLKSCWEYMQGQWIEFSG